MGKIGNISNITLKATKVAFDTADVTKETYSKVFEPMKPAMGYEVAKFDWSQTIQAHTPQAIAPLESAIFDLANRSAMSLGTISEIVSVASSAGLAKTKSELIHYAEVSGKMGAAFKMGAVEVADMMSAWRAGMGLTQSEAEKLGDAVNHLGLRMGVGERDLGALVQNQGALAKGAGLNEVETAALGSAFLASGVGGEQADAAMESLFKTLTSGKYASEKQKAIFKDLNLDPEALASGMQTDATGTIKDVLTALNSVDPGKKIAMTSALFGKGAGGVAGLMANLNNYDNALDSTSDPSKYEGSVKKEAGDRSNLTANKKAVLDNQLNTSSVSMHAPLLSAANSALPVIGKAVTGLEFLAREFPKVAASIAALSISYDVLETVLDKFGSSDDSESSSSQNDASKRGKSSKKNKGKHKKKKGKGKRAKRRQKALNKANRIKAVKSPLTSPKPSMGAKIGSQFSKLARVGSFLKKGSTLRSIASVASLGLSFTPVGGAALLGGAALFAGGAALNKWWKKRKAQKAKMGSSSTQLGGRLNNAKFGKNKEGFRGTTTINFNPTIHVNGENSGTARRDVEKALGVSRDELKRLITQLIHEDRRTSYA